MGKGKGENREENKYIEERSREVRVREGIEFGEERLKGQDIIYIVIEEDIKQKEKGQSYIYLRIEEGRIGEGEGLRLYIFISRRKQVRRNIRCRVIYIKQKYKR